MSRIAVVARTLYDATNARTLVPQPSRDESQPWTEKDAYDVQRLLLASSLRPARDAALSAAESAPPSALVGMKMGMTSHAKMRQMGLSSPIFGFLAGSMVGRDGETMPADAFVQPRVEAEIAFITSRPLAWPVTTAQAMEAVGAVTVAIEILDSRYRDFAFSLPDVIADNTSASRFVLGPTLRNPTELDLGNLGVVLEIDGEPVSVASSAAVLGHPARSLTALLELMHRWYGPGSVLPAGQVVLTGGITEALPIREGQRVRVRADGLGSASFALGAPAGTLAPPIYPYDVPSA